MNECQYTGQSVFDSGGGIAITRGFVGGFEFILLHKIRLCLSYSCYFNFRFFYTKLPNNIKKYPVVKGIYEDIY
jgi:hypothetical protein